MTERRNRVVASIAGEEIEIEAMVLAAAFELSASEIPKLMGRGEITCFCETGLDEDAGRFRLTFFHRNSRLTLVIDQEGRLIQRRKIDFRETPLPPSLRRPGM